MHGIFAQGSRPSLGGRIGPVPFVTSVCGSGNAAPIFGVSTCALPGGGSGAARAIDRAKEVCR